MLMELALLKTLLDKGFYDSHRGVKCPAEIFSEDGQKIKGSIDTAMERYDRSLTMQELEALFQSDNSTMTTAAKDVFSSLFRTMNQQEPLGEDIAKDVLSSLFRRHVGERVANIGFDLVNGNQSSLFSLQQLLDNHGDNFLPEINLEFEDMSVETLLAKNALEARWKFNIPSLARRVEGISDGHLAFIGARSNTGKTSFQCSLIAGPDGFAVQGAKCLVLCNEEGSHRVGFRMLTAATGRDGNWIKNNVEETRSIYAGVKDNIHIFDATGKNMSWVDSVCRTYNPDVLVCDVGDKFATKGPDGNETASLKENAIYARQIAKKHNLAFLYSTQLSAEAEGKIILNQSMMEGSKTGKAAEADLTLLIARNPPMEGQDEEDRGRHVNIAKNKLTGWHGIVHCELNPQTGRYSV